MLNMQNVKDIEIQEGDVRTIHDKDNRLIWGRLAYNTKYAGDTYQQTYSGKNLLVGNYGASTQQGIDHSWNNVYVTLSGTTSSTYSNLTSSIDTAIPAGTYTFSTDKPSSQFRKYIRVRYDGANHDYYIDTGATSVTFTIPDDATDILIRILHIGIFNPGMQIDETFGLMLETGSSASPFEPYTGGVPAPNPDYPQPIQVVTGEQTVKVTGKNLFDTSLATTIGSGASASLITDGIRVTSTASGLWKFVLYNVLEAKDYIGKTITFSCKMKTSSTNDTRMYIGLSNASGTDRSHKVSLNSTGSVSYTVEEDANRPYVCIALYANNNVSSQAGVYTDFTDIQLEVGATSTAYESFQSQTYTIDLGSNEFCKIGDYQDYIYKSGNDWYVHKAIGKILLKDVASNFEYDRRNDSYSINKINYLSQFNLPNSTKNYYVTTFKSNERAPTEIGLSSVGTYVNFNYNNTSTSDGLVTFRNWLTTSLTTMYAPLATPTDTKITDATLIRQLNAVHEWLTRYGYSATVTGNLPIIINQTNL